MLKIVLKNNQKLFITSDTHAYHKNICEGTTSWDLKRSKNNVRPFHTIDAMNQCIVDNINKKVRQDDILLHLGDWSFDGVDKIELFRNRIMCKNIYLVTGNHDHHIVNNTNNVRSLFTGVYDYYTKFDFQFESEDGNMEKCNIILSHFPICSWDSMAKGWIHLFGHMHLPTDKKVMPGKSMDVGMDGNGYRPYDMVEILSIMDKQPIRATTIPTDHHEK
jgi:calcineurin-like phosphoesterase family protein